jgi:hypothetical protein
MIPTKMEILRAIGLLLAAQQQVVELTTLDKTFIGLVLDHATVDNAPSPDNLFNI